MDRILTLAIHFVATTIPYLLSKVTRATTNPPVLLPAREVATATMLPFSLNRQATDRGLVCPKRRGCFPVRTEGGIQCPVARVSRQREIRLRHETRAVHLPRGSRRNDNNVRLQSQRKSRGLPFVWVKLLVTPPAWPKVVSTLPVRVYRPMPKPTLKTELPVLTLLAIVPAARILQVLTHPPLSSTAMAHC